MAKKLCQCLFILFLIQPSNGQCQKLTLKLELKGGAYYGTMNPRWFEQVQLNPLRENPRQLEGATGILTGEKHGKMEFKIEKNKTGTTDSLMLKTNNGWYPINHLKQNKKGLRMSFNWHFQPDPEWIDLQVLKHANQLLSEKNSWNKSDDRICEDDFTTKQWSLYCVLKQAYLDETGDFNHRAPALNVARQLISEQNPKREYDHQLMDFNNEQSYEEIKELLTVCIREMETLLTKD